MREIVSRAITVFLFAMVCLLLLWSLIYLPWSFYNNYRLRHEGHNAVATIIQKYGGRIYYDVEYEGKYYIHSIKVSKKTFRNIQVGEKFEARVLSDKLQYHHNFGITPSYVKIILQPLPLFAQDVETEKKRIKKMYGH